MKQLSMTLSSADVILVKGLGTVTASVGNASAAAERVVLGVFPSGGAGGAVPVATVEEPLRTISPGAVEQYEVAFDTSGAAPGTYAVKLIPYSADDAPEDYAQLGRTVTLTVVDTPVPPPKPRPWWIFILIGVLLVVGIIVAIVVATSNGPAPTPTPTFGVTEITPTSGFSNVDTTVTMTGRFGETTTVTDLTRSAELALTRVSDTEFTFVMPTTSGAQIIDLGVVSDGQDLGTFSFEYTTPLVVTPSFIGFTVDQALTVATATGLVLDIRFLGEFNASIFDQDPPAGVQVPLGSTIRVDVF